MSWPIVKLGDIAEFINGAAFRPEDWGDEGLKIIRIQNLTDKTKPFNRTKRDVDKKLYIKKGDILVSWSATLGVFIWEDEEVGLLNQHIFKVVPNLKIVDKNYLEKALVGALGKMNKHLHGATMKHVNRGEFLATEILLPPIVEQQRIAAILDKAELLMRKRELAVERLATLSKEIFTGMFSGLLEKPNTRLGSAFDVRDGTHDSPKGQTQGYPLITSKNLSNNKINLEDVTFINLEDYEAINRRSKVDYCDILMPMIGTIGNPVIVHDKNPQFAIKNVALIKTGNIEASFYVKGLLETKYFERYVSKESKGGTQKFLSLGNIRNFPIHMPSDAQLQKFSKISKALIQIQSSLVKSQRKLDELLSSLQFSFIKSN